MNRDHNSELSWKWEGVVTLHLILSFVFLCLCLLSTSTDINYLSAYIRPLRFAPHLAIALLIFLLVPTLARRIGKNLHLLFGLGTTVCLYIRSISVWKRDFEFGYGISIFPLTIMGLASFVRSPLRFHGSCVDSRKQSLFGNWL